MWKKVGVDMYVIAIRVPLSYWHTEAGFFTNCYKGQTNEGKATFIGFTNRDEEWMKIKQFKTRKAAENKLAFLQKKIDENGWMWDWELSIQEITKEDLLE